MSIRRPMVAGMFYPLNEEELQKEISLMLKSGKSETDISNIFGIIAPHAGYFYSGRTAAFAYNLLKNKKFTTVIIISPSHREYFKGNCIYEGEAYQTPLGIVNVNQEMAARVAENSNSIFFGVNGHRNEHAIEVHVPFLQTVLEEFTIVPIVMGDQSKASIDELAERIAAVWNVETLVLASTDLSHFYDHRMADKLDSIIEAHIVHKNYDQLQKDLENKRCEACGGGPVVALLKAAALKNYDKTLVLNRTDSGEVTGESNEVVGYLSAVVYG